MELKRQTLRKKIWKEYDPFSGFPINTAKTDRRGGNRTIVIWGTRSEVFAPTWSSRSASGKAGQLLKWPSF